MVHGKGADLELAQDVALAFVNVTQTHISQLLGPQLRDFVQPLAARHLLCVDEPKQEGQGHAVHVAAAGRLVARERLFVLEMDALLVLSALFFLFV